MNGFELLQNDEALDNLSVDLDMDFIGEGSKRNAKNLIQNKESESQGSRSVPQGAIKQRGNRHKQ